MSTKTCIAFLLSLLIGTVLVGSAAVVILAIPALSAKAASLMPLAVATGILLTGPIAATLGPRMRLRHQRTAALRARYRR